MVPDFIETSRQRLKEQETLWKCAMTEEDRRFHQMQLQDPTSGYCSSFVDKKWQKSQERKESRLNRSRSEYYEFSREEHSDTDVSTTTKHDLTEDPSYDELDCSESALVKKRKYEFVEASGSKCDTDDRGGQIVVKFFRRVVSNAILAADYESVNYFGLRLHLRLVQWPFSKWQPKNAYFSPFSQTN